MQTEIQSVWASQTQEVTNSVLPDNITINQPTELSEISLPASEYGTLKWADESYVPNKRVQSCEVLLIPGEGQDLSQVDGWDPETGVVTGYINVIVNEDYDDSEDKTEPQVTVTPDETADITATPSIEAEKSETKTDQNSENDDADSDNAKDDSGNKDADTEEKKSDTEDTVGKLEPADDAKQDADQSEDNNETDSNDDADGNNETDGNDETDDNIFDNPVLPDETDDRPVDADDTLTDEEKEARAEINHTCAGITVSGINLPWYVQFRVSSGDSYQFTNESDAMIFKSYEFELWDLQNDTEYEIPSGEYISVTVPVKAGYQYTIEHLLDNGATETIIPSVDNDVMVFSTHSFSPFGIAGSRELVGPDSGDDSDGIDTVTPTPTPASAQDTTTDSKSSNTVSMNDDSDNNGSSASTQTDSSSANKTADNSAVNTGDTTTILPFVALVVAAVVIIGAVVFIKKKKK